jgi:hypothetical protein
MKLSEQIIEMVEKKEEIEKTIDKIIEPIIERYITCVNDVVKTYGLRSFGGVPKRVYDIDYKKFDIWGVLLHWSEDGGDSGLTLIPYTFIDNEEVETIKLRAGVEDYCKKSIESTVKGKRKRALELLEEAQTSLRELDK